MERRKKDKKYEEWNSQGSRDTWPFMGNHVKCIFNISRHIYTGKFGIDLFDEKCVAFMLGSFDIQSLGNIFANRDEHSIGWRNAPSVLPTFNLAITVPK